MAALALLAIAAGAEIFRLGFFADDFHFLDVARRIPLWRALGGEYGVYPWYRPLSRELYFAAIVAAGPAGAWLARTLSLAAVAASTLLVDRIGGRLLSPRAGRIAAILFATGAMTRFLAAWASGFQDLLALLLTLWAVDALLRGRLRLAAVAAVLAPFAKEPAVVVFPLLGMLAWRPDLRPRRGRTLAVLAAGFVLVVAVHLAVRMRWQFGGSAATITFTPKALAEALAFMLQSFVGTSAVLRPMPFVLAFVTGVLAMVALAIRPGGGRATGASPDSSLPATPRAGLVFAGAAAALGLTPLVGGNVMGWSAAHAYYAFPAMPWLALLAGAALARLPARGLVSMALALLAGWNVLALGARPPDLTVADGWHFHRWDWDEAVRLSTVSARLEGDLLSLFAERPDSLLVYYSGLPVGSFFQTEDGPATRISLDDSSVRSYWVNSAPYGLHPDRAKLVEFDPVTLHLRLTHPGTRFSSIVATSLAAGELGGATAVASVADSSERRTFLMGLLIASARLMAEGPDAYLRGLRAAGLDDTTGTTPLRLAAEALGQWPTVAVEMSHALRHPRNAEGHFRLADSLAAHAGWVTAVLEMRVGLALERRPPADSLRLASMLDRMGNLRRSRDVLAALELSASGTAIADSARARIAELDRRGASTLVVPRRVLGRRPPGSGGS